MKKILAMLLFVNIALFNKGLSQFRISGNITDTTGMPVSYATVSVLKDSNVLKTVTCDTTGRFLLSNIQPGIYQLLCSYAGIRAPAQAVHIIGDTVINVLFTSSISKELLAVTVTAKRPLIERRIDRLVFNVQNSILSEGVSAMDVLRETPRIQITDDEGITMIGKNSLRVMIDGRILNLSDEDVKAKLKSLRSNDIASIEVIPIPPAKYSAAGNSGLINIVLKANPLLGWQGTLNVEYTQRVYASTNQYADINYTSKKLVGSFNLANYHTNILNDNSMSFSRSDNALHSIRRINNIANMQAFNGSLEYTQNPKIKFGSSWSYNILKGRDRNKENNFYTSTASNKLDSTVNSFSYSTSKRKSITAAAYIDYIIDTKTGKKMTITDNYSLNTPSLSRNVSSNILSSYNNDDQKEFIYYGDNEYQINSVFIDFELPFRLLKIETGGAYTDIRNNTGLKLYNILSSQLVIDHRGSSDFLYSEKTPALYLSASKDFSKEWFAKVGIRYEHTFLEGFSPTLALTNITRYGKLFPTAYLLYIPNERNSISLSYSKRIERPNFSDLNPFKFYYGVYSYMSGNPYLLPSFSHNIELNYTFKNNLSILVYGSRLLNGVNSVSLFYNGVNSTTPENYINQNRAGIDLSYRYTPFLNWSINSSGNVFYNKSNSYVPALEISNAEGYGSSFRIQNTVTLNREKTSIFSITYNQFLPSKDGFYEINGYGNLSVNYRYVLLNKRLSLLVSGYDIFNQRKVIKNMKYATSALKLIQYPRVRNISFSINYDFGNKNVKSVNRAYKIDKQRAM